MATCGSTTSISHRMKRPSSTALSLTIGCALSISRMIWHFSPWILILNGIMNLEISFSGMLKLACFYRCYRAFVRGKVESIQAMAKRAAEREEHMKRATRYFHLALRYATMGSGPLVLVVLGRIATGKST